MVHPRTMVQLSDLARSPLALMIIQKDTRGTLSDEEIGILAHVFALLFRSAALGHGTGDEVTQQYSKWKVSMMQGSAPKK